MIKNLFACILLFIAPGTNYHIHCILHPLIQVLHPDATYLDVNFEKKMVPL